MVKRALDGGVSRPVGLVHAGKVGGVGEEQVVKRVSAGSVLADPDAKVSSDYGSVMDYKGQKLAARNTFIINPDGEVVKVYTGVKPAEHSEQVLKDLAELKKS